MSARTGRSTEPGDARGGPDAPAPRAVALRYDGKRAEVSRVVAKGDGHLAERILAVAREHGVPVREDADLVKLLSLSEVGDEIPVEVYQAVAELIAFLYRVNAELGDR